MEGNKSRALPVKKLIDVEKYLRYLAQKWGIPKRQLLALGRLDPNNDSENFNMAYLAVRGSGAVNGVSPLHREVSRRLLF